MRTILETTSVPSSSGRAGSPTDRHPEIEPGKRLEHKEAQAMRNERDHEDTERLAYRFWLERGCPIGSPEDDWFRAEDELRHEVSLPLNAFAMGPDTSR
jgi:hypothetical protein